MTETYARWQRRPWARLVWEGRCAYLDGDWSVKFDVADRIELDLEAELTLGGLEQWLGRHD